MGPMIFYAMIFLFIAAGPIFIRFIIKMVNQSSERTAIAAKSSSSVKDIMRKYKLQYQPKGGCKMGDELSILEHNEIHFSDGISGKVDDIYFNYYECDALMVRDDDSLLPDKQMFFGGVLNFPYDRYFHGSIIICSKKLRKFLKDTKSPMKTESLEFNENFWVFADNQEGAFYILTFEFMEELFDLEWKFKGILVYIREDRLSIFLNEHNLLKTYGQDALSSKEIKKDLDHLLTIPKAFKDLKYADPKQIKRRKKNVL